MSYFLKDSSGRLLPMVFTFDSRRGESTGVFQYRNCINENTGEVYAVPTDTSVAQRETKFGSYCSTNIKTAEENVGDMVKSKYLIIDERNYPKNGFIVGWSNSDPSTHRFYHNLTTGMYNLQFEYKNMYL